jgi:hypothetical protein
MTSEWQGLEQRIKAQCELLERRERARVRRAHHDAQIDGPAPRGKLLAHLVKGGHRCDFEGHLCGSARAVVLEVKTSHASPSWPLGDVRDEQARRLAMVAQDGGLALLYVQRWHQGRAVADYLLPVDGAGRIAATETHPACLVLTMGGERKSVRWTELEAWRVKASELWLDAAGRLGLINGGGDEQA